MTAPGLDCGIPNTVVAQLAGGAATPVRLDRGEPPSTFDGIRVSGRRMRFDDLLSIFLGRLRRPAGDALAATRLGAGRIESGEESLSIASGPALIGAREDPELWAVPREAAPEPP